MDKIGSTFESITGTGTNTNQQDSSNPQAQDQQQSSGRGLSGGLGDKHSGIFGGGEKTDDNLDKESNSDGGGVGQAGDEQVGEFIRSRYKSSVRDGNQVQDAKQS